MNIQSGKLQTSIKTLFSTIMFCLTYFYTRITILTEKKTHKKSVNVSKLCLKKFLRKVSSKLFVQILLKILCYENKV